MHCKDTFEFTEHILELSFSNKTVALFYYIKTKPPTRGNQDLKKRRRIRRRIKFLCLVLICCQVHFTLVVLQIIEHRLEN